MCGCNVGGVEFVMGVCEVVIYEGCECYVGCCEWLVCRCGGVVFWIVVVRSVFCGIGIFVIGVVYFWSCWYFLNEWYWGRYFVFSSVLEVWGIVVF